MKVIGAGFGRTGTTSLKVALEQLGYVPCYHMMEVIVNPAHVDLWEAVLDGRAPDWPTLLGRYEAGVDVPISLYYEALMAAYPDAKVLLTTRDPERWYESVATTIYQMRLMPRWMERLPRLGGFLRLTRRMIWEGFFHDRFEDRDYAIARFNEHNAAVRRIVPAERLLVFDVKDGWAPLCRFLGVPTPDTSFPHVNDRLEMRRRIRVTRLVGWALPTVAGGLVALAFWWLLALWG